MTKQHGALAAAMAGLGLWAIYRVNIERWMYTWGATAEEVAAELPGDELVTEGFPVHDAGGDDRCARRASMAVAGAAR